MARVLLLLPLLAGCELSSTCKCLGPTGPEVDLVAAKGDVSAVFSGTFSGTALDAPGDGSNGVVYETCAIDAQPFTLTLEVGDPESCLVDVDHPELNDDCTAAKEGSFPLSGTLAVGAEEAQAVSGTVRVWSMEDGLFVDMVDLTPPEGDFPHQTLDVGIELAVLDEVAFSGLLWGRRLSEEDAATTVWEVCELPFGG